MNPFDSTHLIGRTEELQRIRAAVEAEGWPWRVVLHHGPQGSGKTALLGAYSRVLSDRGIYNLYLDCSDSCRSPEEIQKRFDQAIGIPPHGDPWEFASKVRGRWAVLLDGFERLEPIVDWLLSSFIPPLPAHCAVFIASRKEPCARWHVWSGGRVLISPIRPLSASEARELLTHRGVPESAHDFILKTTGGHPLAMSVGSSRALAHGESSELALGAAIAEDLQSVMTIEAPDPTHQKALEFACLLRRTTADLLERLLPENTSSDAFQWLSTLPEMNRVPSGLVPMPHLRHAITRSLRWKSPDHFRLLERRVRQVLKERFHIVPVSRKPHSLLDLFFSYRDEPEFATLSLDAEVDHLNVRLDRSRDFESAIVPFAEQHGSVELSERMLLWMRSGCGYALTVCSEDRSRVLGLWFMIEVVGGETEKLPDDPPLTELLHGLHDRFSLRVGEQLRIGVWSLLDPSVDQPSAVQTLIYSTSLTQAVSEFSPLSVSGALLPVSSPRLTIPGFMGYDAERGFSVELSGETMTPVLHDWRRRTPENWFQAVVSGRLSDRRSQLLPVEETFSKVLTREEFEDAVLGLLRNFHDDGALLDNALLDSKLVHGRVGSSASGRERAEILRDLVQAEVESFGDTPRQHQQREVLEQTYLEPAPSQEQAADRLGLPLSTFRRYLRNAISTLCERLWTRELEQ